MEDKARAFIDQHVQQIRPLEKEARLAYWRAAVSGKAELYRKAAELELQIRTVYSDARDFKKVAGFKEHGHFHDALIARQIDLLYNDFLANQIRPDLLKRIVELSTRIEEKFSTFRPTLEGKKVTDNEIHRLLKSEGNTETRKAAWLAGHQVGEEVAGELIKLIKWRNQAARHLGFENYHTFSLYTAEQQVDQIDRLFSELEERTREPFRQVKLEIDTLLARGYGITTQELQPWHYHDPFFQETPQVYEINLDRYYEQSDVLEIGRAFYRSIGLAVDDILARSDLYEKPGKNPHAFCEAIDRQGDVRILCNLKNDENWMETLLHELGHAVYETYQDGHKPYLLREPAHIFTTEAVAMFFGRLSRNPAWMRDMLDLSAAELHRIRPVAQKYARLKQLIFIRWALVMYYFEKALYADPDQDLNHLWWKLKEKFQLLHPVKGRNKADWAVKIHFAIAPCYYHNYVLGELLASQIRHVLTKRYYPAGKEGDISFTGLKALGTYFKDHIFKPGRSLPWNEMIQSATGQPLSAEYFIESFI